VKGDPPDGSIKIEYSGTYLGSRWAVVHWFAGDLTGLPSAADLDSIANDAATAFHDKLVGPFCHTSCHFTETAVTVFLPLSQKRRRVRVADSTGADSSDPLPAQVSILIDWSSLDGRKGGKPRSYMPGVPSGHVTESYSVDPSDLATLNGHVADYVTAVNAISAGAVTSMKFVEMVFVSGGAYLPTGSTFTFDIDSGHVRPVLATQRRRSERQAA